MMVGEIVDAELFFNAVKDRPEIREAVCRRRRISWPEQARHAGFGDQRGNESDMNTVTAKPQQQIMLLDSMASRAGLRPQEFADTVRKTCGLATATNEEFAAFLLVAREYDLNPILREIYAFPRKGGGVVPILSVDGWISLINRQPQYDGVEFDVHHDNDNRLVAVTCRMFRKDRAHPVVISEYLSECIRPTEPWKMPHRMLRHKALVQAARVAFGFSNVFDEDEGQKIADIPAREIIPAKKLVVPPAPPPDDHIPDFGRKRGRTRCRHDFPRARR